ncbi:MAG: hypothetical protein AAGA68_13190 [Pseudomonadota bacterium]
MRAQHQALIELRTGLDAIDDQDWPIPLRAHNVPGHLFDSLVS